MRSELEGIIRLKNNKFIKFFELEGADSEKPYMTSDGIALYRAVRCQIGCEKNGEITWTRIVSQYEDRDAPLRNKHINYERLFSFLLQYHVFKRKNVEGKKNEADYVDEDCIYAAVYDDPYACGEGQVSTIVTRLKKQEFMRDMTSVVKIEHKQKKGYPLVVEEDDGSVPRDEKNQGDEEKKEPSLRTVTMLLQDTTTEVLVEAAQEEDFFDLLKKFGELDPTSEEFEDVVLQLTEEFDGIAGVLVNALADNGFFEKAKRFVLAGFIRPVKETAKMLFVSLSKEKRREMRWVVDSMLVMLSRAFVVQYINMKLILKQRELEAAQKSVSGSSDIEHLKDRLLKAEKEKEDYQNKFFDKIKNRVSNLKSKSEAPEMGR